MNKESEGVRNRRMEAVGDEMHERCNIEEGESSKLSKFKNVNVVCFVILIA